MRPYVKRVVVPWILNLGTHPTDRNQLSIVCIVHDAEFSLYNQSFMH